MAVAPIVVGSYGLFSLIGGVIGYVKANSRPSLVAGTVSGLFLLGCAKNRFHQSARAALRAPRGQLPGATTMAYKDHRYVEEERRRRWPRAAATHARPTRGDGPIRVGGRRCSSLTYSSFEYATLPRAWPALRFGPSRPRGLMKPVLGMAAGQPAAALGSAVIALALGGRFAGTWRRNRRLMPDLLMVLFSLSSLVAAGLWWLGSH